MIKLINGECIKEMRLMEDCSVDMMLTDPPYGISYASNRRKEKHKKIKSDDSLDWLGDFVFESHRIMRENSICFVFCSHHNVDEFKRKLQARFKIKDILIWVKNNAGVGDLKGSFAPKYEMIIMASKGRRLINGKRTSNVLEYNKIVSKMHPTEKPVDLLKHLIVKFSNEGDLIIDPFMGCGSTAVACIESGRRFAGIELDNDYYRSAKKRVSNKDP